MALKFQIIINLRKAKENELNKIYKISIKN